MTHQQIVNIYTDGGSLGNPGLSAIGIVIKKPDGSVKKYSKKIGEATNNEAEYKAVIFALEKAKLIFGKNKIKQMQFNFYLDSKLVVFQLEGKYKILEKNLQNLFCYIWNLKIDFGNVKFYYVPREKNREADNLVKKELEF